MGILVLNNFERPNISTFMSEVWDIKGDRNFEMTREKVNESMTNDFLDQQNDWCRSITSSGCRVDHKPNSSRLCWQEHMLDMNLPWN